jgi:hypothetical protein
MWRNFSSRTHPYERNLSNNSNNQKERSGSNQPRSQQQKLAAVLEALIN